eukprot:670619-Pleurochrysis_carterae.AAC.1
MRACAVRAPSLLQVTAATVCTPACFSISVRLSPSGGNLRECRSHAYALHARRRKAGSNDTARGG